MTVAYTRKRPQFAIITGASGDIVAAVPGWRIRVIAWLASITVAGKFQSNAATDLTGSMGAGIYNVSMDQPDGLFETKAGEKLSKTFTGEGHLTYVLVKDIATTPYAI